MRLGSDSNGLDVLASDVADAAWRIGEDTLELHRAVESARWHGRDRDETAAATRTIAILGAAIADRLIEFGRDLGLQADTQRYVSGVRRPRLGDAPTTVLLDDTTGDGRRVVVVGDLAEATHVAVVVPGMGVSRDRFSGLLADAQRLQHRAAIELGDRGDVAVVAWLGYDAPAGLDRPWSIDEVLDDDAAVAGAGALRAFLDAAAIRDDAVVSLVGHSYGSLVAALAARGRGDIDRLVVLGSPGLGVDRATDLGLAPGTSLYAAAAPGDPVAATGWFGRSPTEPEFGAVVIDSRAWPLMHDPSWRRAHSSYFDECSQILDNLAGIVVDRRPRLAVRGMR